MRHKNTAVQGFIFPEQPYFIATYILFYKLLDKLFYKLPALLIRISIRKRSVAAYSCSSIRFVMLFKLIARVEVLCRSAEVVGARIPPTPSKISPRLKLMTKR